MDTNRHLNDKRKRPVNPLKNQREVNVRDIEEMLERRTRFGKVFRLGTNRYQAVTYTRPVHFRDAQGGAWREIDNTLCACEHEGERGVCNTAGDMRACFLSAGEAPFVHLDAQQGARLSYGVAGCARVAPQASNAPLNKGRSLAARRERVAAQLESEVLYPDIFDGASLVCHLGGKGFKDEVVFADLSAVRPVTFYFDAHGNTMVRNEDGDIKVLSAQDNSVVFHLPAPFLKDADGEIGTVATALALKDGRYSLECVPNAAFCERAAYPLSLDPAIYTPNNVTAKIGRAHV